METVSSVKFTLPDDLVDSKLQAWSSKASRDLVKAQ